MYGWYPFPSMRRLHNVEDYSVFPNPARDLVNIRLNRPVNHPLKGTISDLAGETVLDFTFHQQHNILDVSGLGAGAQELMGWKESLLWFGGSIQL